ncbi:uncharacterized protein BDW43DRAFT_314980 [Aspergillus alliaceus]|uniref:uncharacterized protein n=1 Tax=Petromyces alliaceus TaxID=209559 RepID=UPI0012A6CB99|nr:uncharacterized protein BDW43DRAFT_314980 [Aspergillus alliaceus]KAB8229401.1 hypothetical protein BDW43DRAFT_314980 [Aspergillus alliaceus]
MDNSRSSFDLTAENLAKISDIDDTNSNGSSAAPRKSRSQSQQVESEKWIMPELTEKILDAFLDYNKKKGRKEQAKLEKQAKPEDQEELENLDQHESPQPESAKKGEAGASRSQWSSIMDASCMMNVSRDTSQGY